MRTIRIGGTLASSIVDFAAPLGNAELQAVTARLHALRPEMLERPWGPSPPPTGFPVPLSRVAEALATGRAYPVPGGGVIVVENGLSCHALLLCAEWLPPVGAPEAVPDLVLTFADAAHPWPLAFRWCRPQEPEETLPC